MMKTCLDKTKELLLTWACQSVSMNLYWTPVVGAGPGCGKLDHFLLEFTVTRSCMYNGWGHSWFNNPACGGAS
jgi:hypothetical protein